MDNEKYNENAPFEMHMDTAKKILSVLSVRNRTVVERRVYRIIRSAVITRIIHDSEATGTVVCYFDEKEFRVIQGILEWMNER